MEFSLNLARVQNYSDPNSFHWFNQPNSTSIKSVKEIWISEIFDDLISSIMLVVKLSVKFQGIFHWIIWRPERASGPFCTLIWWNFPWIWLNLERVLNYSDPNSFHWFNQPKSDPIKSVKGIWIGEILSGHCTASPLYFCSIRSCVWISIP